MRHKVIIVDDEHEDRQQSYKRLAEAINSLDSGFAIDIDFVRNPNQLQGMIRRNDYSGAVVDAVLEINWKDFNITKALNILGTNIPVAILSDRWDETNAEQIDEALKKPNCRTFLHWRDINPDGKGQIDYAIRSIEKMLADHLNLDTQLQLGPNDPIRIVHISDVHTGGVGSNTLKLEAKICADKILNYWGNNQPTFVAFTGDVTEYGVPKQYKSARKWIEYFFARLQLGNLPNRSLLYVLGNHDVNLGLAAGARIKLISNPEKGEEALKLELSSDLQQPELIGYAYAPFRNFLSEICDCPLITEDIDDTNFAWVESRFRHLGVIFYGLNTAHPATAFGLPEREADPDALAQIGIELKDAVESCSGSQPLVVGLSHHSPFPTEGDNAVKNPGEFAKFFRGNVKTALFLHGHIHEHQLKSEDVDGSTLVISGAATLTKGAESRPSDSLRGLNLLTLERKSHVVTSLKASSFGWLKNDLIGIGNSRAWKRQDNGLFTS